MSEPAEGGEVREIIIVKRRGGDEDDAHHGGVWKVAFADFMTAMMAFFLVLWIVNSTTRETKTSLARYFNPIKLTESSSAKRGVTESKEQQDDILVEDKDVKPKPSESVGDTKPKKEKGSKADAPHEKSDTSKTKDNAGVQTEPKEGAPAPAIPPAPLGMQMGEITPTLPRESPPAAALQPAIPLQNAAQSPAQDQRKSGDGKAHDAFKDPFERKALKGAKQAAMANLTQDAASQAVKDDLTRALGSEEIAKLGGNLEVKADSEGTLISLNEGADFVMYALGSAEPEQRLFKILGALAQTLRTRPGTIVVRGHTDGRPYRNGVYDNWQLSSARAQAAFQILLRAGLEEKRIERIEGYADHRLKKPNDPNAPENRRIEILLRKDKA